MKKISIIILILISFVLTGCKIQGHKIVHFEVINKGAIDFDKYKNIFFEDIKINSSVKSYDPIPDINEFFLEEFPKAIKRDIKRAEVPESISKDPVSGSSLIIRGELTLKTIKRSIIREKKKEKKFVKVENWEMEMKIFFTDMKSGKKVFFKTLKSLLNTADPKKPDYNFKFLFTKITEKLIKGIIRVGKTERRYLLIK
ncbi:MAG: hypothetical protein ABFR75_08115 [Acidobacteriota bacterium]